jgi:hypothetical protein
MNRLIAPALVASALVLAACSKPEPTAPPAPEATAEAAPAPVAEPTPAPAASTGEPSLPRNDATVINLEGFGPAKFGANEEQVRIAWGSELVLQPSPEGSTCQYLFPPPRPDGRYGIGFMMEDGALVRYESNSPEFVAPGDLAVGMHADAVMVAFPGQVESVPHKYVEGERYLVYTPADGSDVRLVFEVDAQGIITQWRIGRLPQVEYVEGCS